MEILSIRRKSEKEEKREERRREQEVVEVFWLFTLGQIKPWRGCSPTWQVHLFLTFSIEYRLDHRYPTSGGTHIADVSANVCVCVCVYACKRQPTVYACMRAALPQINILAVYLRYRRQQHLSRTREAGRRGLYTRRSFYLREVTGVTKEKRLSSETIMSVWKRDERKAKGAEGRAGRVWKIFGEVWYLLNRTAAGSWKSSEEDIRSTNVCRNVLCYWAGAFQEGRKALSFSIVLFEYCPILRFH